MTNKENFIMKRNLSYLTLVVLIALLATATGCGAGKGDVENHEATLVAQIVPTASIAPTSQVGDTPTHTPELGPTATPTPIPEPTATPTPAPELTPTSTPCVPRTDWVIYTVQPDETMYSIAARYGMTAEELQQANCLSSTDVIQVGQDLYVPYHITPSPTPCIPPADWALYTVKSGENLFRIALRYGMTAEALRQANCLSSADTIQAGQLIYVPYIIPSTPLPTDIPPTPTDTSTSGIPEGVKEEVFFDLGGEPVVCNRPDPGGDPQQITYAREQDEYTLCVYGFPMDEEITVELTAPDGLIVAPRAFSVEEDPIGTTIAKIDLWIPVGLATGNWLATVRSPSGVVSDSIDSRFTQPAINTMPEGNIDPFESQKCDTYQPGEQVVARGTNYELSQNFPLAIYHLDPDAPLQNGGYFLTLARWQIEETDNQGNFSTTILIEASDLAGYYLVVLATGPDADVFRRVEANNDCYQVP
jgi:LysM repeat protein